MKMKIIVIIIIIMFAGACLYYMCDKHQPYIYIYYVMLNLAISVKK